MSTMSQIRMHIWKDGKSRDYVVYDVDNMIPNVDSVTFSGVVKAEDTPVATSPATPSTTPSSTPKEVNTTTNGVVAAPIQESKKVVSTSETNKKTNVKAENIESTNTQPSKTMASTVPSPVVASQAASPKNASTILYHPADGEGVFSIGENKQVVFALGNLRYTQSTGIWDFAENQYDMVNVNNIEVGGTIDLFGWSGNQSAEKPWGVNASTNNTDYAGEFVDWGTNTIANTQPNTWRTLTADEWNYFDPERKKSMKGAEESSSAEVDADGYLKFQIPWSLSVSYGISMREDTSAKINPKRMRYPYRFNQTLNFSGNVRISEGWNINFSSGYDFH